MFHLLDIFDYIWFCTQPGLIFVRGNHEWRCVRYTKRYWGEDRLIQWTSQNRSEYGSRCSEVLNRLQCQHGTFTWKQGLAGISLAVCAKFTRNMWGTQKQHVLKYLMPCQASQKLRIEPAEITQDLQGLKFWSFQKAINGSLDIGLLRGWVVAVEWFWVKPINWVTIKTMPAIIETQPLKSNALLRS